MLAFPDTPSNLPPTLNYFAAMYVSKSNAKSGQFFFYSKDGKYMIKTMTSAESKFLRRSKNQ
jgi:hypothetical protein